MLIKVMTYTTMELTDALEAVLESYHNFQGGDYEYYSNGRTITEEDGQEIEVFMEDEVIHLFKNGKVPCTTEYVSGFDSPGYANDFFAISWVEDGLPKLRCVQLERY